MKLFQGPMGVALGMAAMEQVTPWYLNGGVAKANCIGAWLPATASTLAASYVNLVTPGTHNLTAGSTAPTLNGGWVADGAAYLVSDITELATWTTIIKFSGMIDDANTRTLWGTYKTAGTIIRSAYNNVSAGHTYRNGTAALGPATPLSSGVVAIANDTAYLNGVSDGTIPDLADVGLPFYVLAINNDGAAFGILQAGKILAMATYDVTLTQAQIQAIGAALP